MVPVSAGTGPAEPAAAGRLRRGTCMSRAVPKMDPRAANMAVAVWNGCARDARRHAYQWRPVDRWWQDSKDVGLRARARSRSSLCKSSSISLVDLVLVQGYMVLLKNC